jgi:hypothetical protein
VSNREDRAIAKDLMGQWRAAVVGQQVRGRLIYDRLIDWVETHGLNYSAYDPRGPKETDPAYD